MTSDIRASMGSRGAGELQTDPGPGGRLGLLGRAELSTTQRATYDYLQQTKISWASASGFEGALPDGRLIGPFNAFLYSPEIGRGFNEWVDAEGDHSTLSARVRQVVVLTVGAAWGAEYEMYAHAAVGRAAGLDERLIAALCTESAPVGLSKPETAAYEFTRALVADHAVSDGLYGAAVAAFGERGVVDLVHLIGIYLATSALLNAFCVPVPSEQG